MQCRFLTTEIFGKKYMIHTVKSKQKTDHEKRFLKTECGTQWCDWALLKILPISWIAFLIPSVSDFEGRKYFWYHYLFLTQPLKKIRNTGFVFITLAHWMNVVPEWFHPDNSFSFLKGPIILSLQIADRMLFLLSVFLNAAQLCVSKRDNTSSWIRYVEMLSNIQ